MFKIQDVNAALCLKPKPATLAPWPAQPSPTLHPDTPPAEKGPEQAVLWSVKVNVFTSKAYIGLTIN